MSSYIFRVKAAKGLEETLVKELRHYLHLRKDQIQIIPGRRSIEVRGSQETLYRLLSRSRIAEDVQLKIGSSFKCRGEEELKQNLQKLPFHGYLPIKDHHKFRTPQVTAKSHKSKLYHTHLARNLVLSHLVELPIQRAFKMQPEHLQKNFNGFKKEWLKEFEMQRPQPGASAFKKAQQAEIVKSTDSDGAVVTQEFKGLDAVRQKL
jgi:23S rRNA G2445 N2-methylase RlmL